MQIHELKPKNRPQKKKRIARSGERGYFSGKGVKGQRSRAGAKMAPMIRELIKRYPKLRGYKFSPLSKVQVVNVGVVNKVFEEGDKVTPQALREKKLLKKSKKFPVKILGKGKIEKKINVEDCIVSAAAKEKIEKAGGTIESKN